MAERDGAHPGDMRAIDVRSSLVSAALVLALAGCGQAEPAESAQGDNPGHGSSSGTPTTGDQLQRITPGAIAAIVLEHLGSDTVRQFVTYEQEPGSVSIMVRLRDATPHNFAVQVYSPDQAEMFGAAGRCPREHGPEGKFRCRTLANDTTITTIEDDTGFSDDNADGMVISSSAITPDDGGVLALYESYDDTPAVSVDDLEDLLTDPRLSWLTDPAVNRAGEEVAVKELAG